MNQKKIIECPNCQNQIDVDEIMYQHLQIEMKKDFSTKLSHEKAKIEIQIREQITEEKSEEIKSFKQQLDAKIKEARELHKIRADFERLQREKDELKEKIEADFENKFSLKLNEEKNIIKKEIEERVELKISEREHIITQLKDQLKEAQRKAEQGSMQIQGEVQEVAIEEFLRTNFPMDTISEIKKGSRGADCLQIVNTRARQNCGIIYYESKRAKDFKATWIEKFKDDMREQNAIFGVLVTDVLPKGMERYGQKSNVWLCTFSEFQGLCFVLREAIILWSNALVVQENKGGKMEMLYEYLTGHEFRMQIEAIVEGFSQMNNDLNSEKRAMESIWKKREKQIQKVILNTTHMYSTIKGIAGNSVGTIQVLELSSNETENESKKPKK